MTRDDVLGVLREAGALLEGRSTVSSGLGCPIVPLIALTDYKVTANPANKLSPERMAFPAVKPGSPDLH